MLAALLVNLPAPAVASPPPPPPSHSLPHGADTPGSVSRSRRHRNFTLREGMPEKIDVKDLLREDKELLDLIMLLDGRRPA